MPPRKRKSSDSFFLFFCFPYFNFESIDRYYRGRDVLNQLMKFIFQKSHQKKMKWSFLKHRKKFSIFSFIRIKNIMIIKKSTGHPLSLTRGGPVDFLHFHFKNSVQPITTGMNPIRNMNHKRKYQLNRSQEYQLQYLLSKEESFQ